MLNPSSPTRNHAAPLLAGAILGALALWLAFRGADWSELQRALATVDLRIALLGTLCAGLSLCLNTYRWRRLFRPVPREPGVLAFFRALTIGQAVNILLPLRAGDVARLYALSARTPISAAQVLPTLIVEKVFDFACFAAAIVWLMLMLAWPAASPAQAAGRAVIALAALGALGVLARVDLRRTWPRSIGGRAGERWRGVMSQLAEGLQVLADRRVARDVALASGGLVLLSALTNLAVLRACGLSLPMTAPVLMVVSFQAGSMPPSLPGRIGVMHFATAVSLTPFGVRQEEALTAALVLYIVAIVPRLVVGLVMLAGLRFRGGAGRAVPIPERAQPGVGA